MIKNSFRTMICFFLSLLTTSFFLPVLSQIPVPQQWNSFVQDVSCNVLVKDTFLFQSFENDCFDTWSYAASGGADRIDASADGIKGQSGAYSLKLPSGSSVEFMRFGKPSLYTDICVCASYAGNNLSQGDKLILEILKEEKNIRSEWYTVPSNVRSFNYGAKGTPIRFQDHPEGLIISTPNTNKSGCFYIDKVFAFGQIPQYSLFSGTGNWEDEDLWTHLPPLRNRSALVKGDVSVYSNTECKDVAISSGSVYIAKDASLAVDTLTFFSSNADAVMDLDGNLTVKDQIAVDKTFNEKGKWYFISFPFDVYLSGIDPAFELRDDTPNAGGNYFYVRSYNGAKRASAGSTDENWQILKLSDVSASSPVFERNKGYLIALDDLALSQTVRFTSSKGVVQEYFGKTLSFPIKAPLAGMHEEDNGWCLCGNPFPSLLPLGCIEPNTALDGYVYIYEEGGYKPYLIGSNYALPPFATFFVKASADTEIVFRNQPADDCILLAASSPLSSVLSEPYSDEKTLQSEIVSEQMSPLWFQDGNHIVIENMPDNGTVQLINLSGCVLLEKRIEKGFSALELFLKPGLYILKIETKSYHACQKFVKVE